MSCSCICPYVMENVFVSCQKWCLTWIYNLLHKCNEHWNNLQLAYDYLKLFCNKLIYSLPLYYYVLYVMMIMTQKAGVGVGWVGIPSYFCHPTFKHCKPLIFDKVWIFFSRNSHSVKAKYILRLTIQTILTRWIK